MKGDGEWELGGIVGRERPAGGDGVEGNSDIHTGIEKAGRGMGQKPGESLSIHSENCLSIFFGDNCSFKINYF